MHEHTTLLFPTHYLGNFVLGLPWVLQVAQDYPNLTLVIDSRFRELTDSVVPASVQIIEYPRQALKAPGSALSKLASYLRFLRQLRRATHKLIIDMEGERFTGVLSRLSGAKLRLGPTGKNAHLFYNNPRDLDYGKHRYNAFGQILDLIVQDTPPSNVLPYRLPETSNEAVDVFLKRSKIHGDFLVIHPGASADYKKWPVDYFAKLYDMLGDAELQVVWIGIGDDKKMIDAIAAKLQEEKNSKRRTKDAPVPPPIELIHLDLTGYLELTALFKRSRYYVGGDSGPMHLAASAGLDLVALFGPSKEAIWAPLGEHSRVLRGTKKCGKDCDAWQCDFNYHCLSSLIPEVVFGAATATKTAMAMREPAQ